MIPTYILAFLMSLSTPAQAAPTDSEAKLAVGKSLNYLEKGGTAWMEQRKCTSCHTVGMMIWAHNEAGRRGFDLPTAKIQGWMDWALADLNARGKEAGPYPVAQLLHARGRSEAAESSERLLNLLINLQNPTGAWKPGTQLKGPSEATTRWALLALDLRGSPAHPSELAATLNARIPESRKLAMGWLKEEPPDESLEARILRLLMMRKTEPALAQIWLLELMDLQKPDGGWSYRKEASESDALATGLALYCAMLQGHPRDNAQVRRAREYLLKTVKEDGSWNVPTSAFHEVPAGKKTDGTDAIYSYWGTAWATLGLLHTLPQ